MAKKKVSLKTARRKARIVVSLTMPQELIEYLDQTDTSRSQFICGMIERSKAFKEWKKGRKES